MIVAQLSISAASQEPKLPAKAGQPADFGSEAASIFEALLGESAADNESADRSAFNAEPQDVASGHAGGQCDGATAVPAYPMSWPPVVSLLAPVDAAVSAATTELSGNAKAPMQEAGPLPSAPTDEARTLAVGTPAGSAMPRLDAATKNSSMLPLAPSNAGSGEAMQSLQDAATARDVVAWPTTSSQKNFRPAAAQESPSARSVDASVKFLGELRHLAVSPERAFASTIDELRSRLGGERPLVAEHLVPGETPSAVTAVEQIAGAARQLAQLQLESAPGDVAAAAAVVQEPYTTPKSTPAEVVKSIRLALHPIDLGHVDVRLSMAADGALRVHMRFESEKTADIVASHRSTLVEALAASAGALEGPVIDTKGRSQVDLTVSVGDATQTAGSGSGSFDGGRNNQQRPGYAAGVQTQGTIAVNSNDAKPPAPKSGMFV